MGERFEKGMENLKKIFGDAGEERAESLGDLGKYITEFTFGDIYGRMGLSARDREMIAISILASRSGMESQLRTHIKAGLNVGLTIEEIEEIMIQTVPYSGFPTAIIAIDVLKEFK